MASPETREEFIARSELNIRIEGHGLEATIHMCCPFCAAADFLTYRIVDFERVISKGADCGECGRGARAVITRGEAMEIELLQTHGPDIPDYLPKIRREQ